MELTANVSSLFPSYLLFLLEKYLASFRLLTPIFLLNLTQFLLYDFTTLFYLPQQQRFWHKFGKLQKCNYLDWKKTQKKLD